MDLLKILKFIVFLVSFAMFCYQLNIATINLMDPPTVLSQYERDITDDDLPLITVCPTNQTNVTRLTELGYSTYDRMLYGFAEFKEKYECNTGEDSTYDLMFNNDYDECKEKGKSEKRIQFTSWGDHRNLTFDKLTEQVFNISIDISEGKFKNSSVFIPYYGLCEETSFLNYTKEIVLHTYNPYDARVFVTDKNYRSFFMLDVASQVGSKIFIKPNTKHYINVMIQERNYCKKNEIPMSEEDFKKCVDNKIQNEFEKMNISCIPPWLSYNKQCNQTYHETFYGKFNKEFIKNYIDMVRILSNIRFEEECRQSCKETLYVVNEKGSKAGVPRAYLTFNQKVIVTEKVPNYDMFKYIIDVGSSLGLWLGLSVLGLHDLFVWAIQFINNSFITKKIKSAVTK